MVFENKELRRMLSFKIIEVIQGWRKLHQKGLQKLHNSQIIITVIKSKKMAQSGHAERTKKERNTETFESETPKERECMRHLCVHWQTIK